MNELIQEALRQIIEEPWMFMVEVVQFLLLVLIIRLLLPRLVGTALKERRKRIADQVEKADQADTAYAKAQQQAAALVAAAPRKPRGPLKQREQPRKMSTGPVVTRWTRKPR